MGVSINENTNIAIIGMPGSGKTTVGRELARLSGRLFFDTDDMIKKRMGMNASRIITQLGEPFFRDLETECLTEAASHVKAVISTGGGVVTRPNNLSILKSSCYVIQITRPLEKLYTKNRPLSLIKGVERIYMERGRLYDLWSDVTIGNEYSRITARIIMDTLMI